MKLKIVGTYSGTEVLDIVRETKVYYFLNADFKLT